MAPNAPTLDPVEATDRPQELTPQQNAVNALVTTLNDIARCSETSSNIDSRAIQFNMIYLYHQLELATQHGVYEEVVNHPTTIQAAQLLLNLSIRCGITKYITQLRSTFPQLVIEEHRMATLLVTPPSANLDLTEHSKAQLALIDDLGQDKAKAIEGYITSGLQHQTEIYLRTISNLLAIAEEEGLEINIPEGALTKSKEKIEDHLLHTGLEESNVALAKQVYAKLGLTLDLKSLVNKRSKLIQSGQFKMQFSQLLEDLMAVVEREGLSMADLGLQGLYETSLLQGNEAAKARIRETAEENGVQPDHKKAFLRLTHAYIIVVVSSITSFERDIRQTIQNEGERLAQFMRENSIELSPENIKQIEKLVTRLLADLILRIDRNCILTKENALFTALNNLETDPANKKISTARILRSTIIEIFTNPYSLRSAETAIAEIYNGFPNDAYAHPGYGTLQEGHRAALLESRGRYKGLIDSDGHAIFLEAIDHLCQIPEAETDEKVATAIHSNIARLETYLSLFIGGVINGGQLDRETRQGIEDKINALLDSITPTRENLDRLAILELNTGLNFRTDARNQEIIDELLKGPQGNKGVSLLRQLCLRRVQAAMYRAEA